jgi:hypothetical protein
MPTPVHPSGRSGVDRRTVVRIVAAWVIAAVVVLFVAAVTSVGPVLLARGTHGVHVTDVVVMLLAAAVAARFTARQVRRARPR